ncbi:hypothetical protein [Flavobacterium sp. JP2137]|uniref:hypothetical protein n=1 Tax=Flavobacterium sp. JP2137 TaxID=3414510 RepID=UPI003D2FD197
MKVILLAMTMGISLICLAHTTVQRQEIHARSVGMTLCMDTVVPLFEDQLAVLLATMYSGKNALEVDDCLKNLDEDCHLSANQKAYWKSYLYYNKSLYFKNILNDEPAAKENIQHALEQRLKGAATSEDYALIAACYAFSIQFADRAAWGGIATKVEECAKKALALNPNNIRAYYALASHHFYQPKGNGSWAKAEEYALKGLRCKTGVETGFYSPHWGKMHLYELLLQLYRVENRAEDAAKIEEIIKRTR